jgi:hypothetical protein
MVLAEVDLYNCIEESSRVEAKFVTGSVHSYSICRKPCRIYTMREFQSHRSSTKYLIINLPPYFLLSIKSLFSSLK